MLTFFVTGENTLDKARNEKKGVCSAIFERGFLFFISGVPICQLWRAIK